MQAFQYELIHLRKNCLVSQRHNDELICILLLPVVHRGRKRRDQRSIGREQSTRRASGPPRWPSKFWQTSFSQR